MSRALCATCGWSQEGPLATVSEKLTEHHQETKRWAADGIKNLDDSPSGQERRKGRILALAHYPALILSLLVAICGCVPMFDPVTVENIRSLQTPEAAAAHCTAFLAREEAKQGQARDEKSIRHLTELCDCYAEAQTRVQISACRANVEAYAVYETNKR